MMGEAKRRTERLGDAPVEAEYRDRMTELARFVDHYFNDDADPKKTGFILMVFPFEGHEGRCNYISNAMRADVVTLLKEQVKRFEGMADQIGTA